MQIYVLLKMVPDTVEELNVAADQQTLDAEYLRFKLSDPDEHALEQGLLLKERHGGKVTVVAPDAPELDDALFAALAKGADRVVKLAVEPAPTRTVAVAEALAAFLRQDAPTPAPDTLILCGSYAIDDLDGELAPYLAEAFQMPLAMVVSGLQLEAGNKAVVMREFFGGLRGEFELALPAIIGIQSAEKPPRYVPIAKIRAVMKTGKIESVPITLPAPGAALALDRLYKPEAAGRAQMLEGSPEEVAEKIVAVLTQQSLI